MHQSLFRSFVFVNLSLTFFILTGCASTQTHTKEVTHSIPELNVIQAKFNDIVEEIYSRKDEVWHHGYMGNFTIYWNGGNNRGYCHEWQEEVYKSITPLVRELGWQSDRINVGVGTPKEHHVVLVYDPNQLSRPTISATPKEVEAYVLDAWYHGRSDIYLFKDWLNFVFNGRTDFAFEIPKAKIIEEPIISASSPEESRRTSKN